MLDDAFYPEEPAISLELTNYCNLQCPYCGSRNLTRTRGYMEWELLEKIVAECKGGRHGIDYLIGAGEPLLYPRLEDAIRLIREHDAGLANLVTNGVLLTPDKTRKLLDAGLRLIRISLDSLDADLYASTRAADLTRVVGNIRELIRIAPSTVSIQIALMNSSVQLLSQRNIDEFYEVFGVQGNVQCVWADNVFIPTAEDYRVSPTPKTWCALSGNFFCVAYDGRVWLCCADQDVQHPLGDLKNDSIDAVWLKEANQEAFSRVAFGEPGASRFCIEKCGLEIDYASQGASHAEIEQMHVKKLLHLAGMTKVDSCLYFVKPEVFLKHALTIDPGNPEVLAALDAAKRN